MLRTQLLDQDDRLVADLAHLAAAGDDDADQRFVLQLRLEVVDARVDLVALAARRQADPLAVRLDRPLARLEGPRLGRLAAAGGRGLERPPVVEDAGNVERRRGPARSP